MLAPTERLKSAACGQKHSSLRNTRSRCEIAETTVHCLVVVPAVAVALLQEKLAAAKIQEEQKVKEEHPT